MKTLMRKVGNVLWQIRSVRYNKLSFGKFSCSNIARIWPPAMMDHFVTWDYTLPPPPTLAEVKAIFELLCYVILYHILYVIHIIYYIILHSSTATHSRQSKSNFQAIIVARTIMILKKKCIAHRGSGPQDICSWRFDWITLYRSMTSFRKCCWKYYCLIKFCRKSLRRSSNIWGWEQCSPDGF